MKVTAALTYALVLAASLPLAAQAPPRQDGRWEVKMDMENVLGEIRFRIALTRKETDLTK